MQRDLVVSRILLGAAALGIVLSFATAWIPGVAICATLGLFVKMVFWYRQSGRDRK